MSDPRAPVQSVMWAVSSGSYSDYRVKAIFSTKELAESAAALGGADYQAEAITYLDRLPEKKVVWSMSVEVWDDGTTTTGPRGERSDTFWEFDAWDPRDLLPVHWRWVRAPVHKDKGGRLDVRGTDLERCRKVLSDRKAQLLAEDAFRMRKEVTG